MVLEIPIRAGREWPSFRAKNDEDEVLFGGGDRQDFAEFEERRGGYGGDLSKA